MLTLFNQSQTDLQRAWGASHPLTLYRIVWRRPEGRISDHGLSVCTLALDDSDDSVQVQALLTFSSLHLGLEFVVAPVARAQSPRVAGGQYLALLLAWGGYSFYSHSICILTKKGNYNQDISQFNSQVLSITWQRKKKRLTIFICNGLHPREARYLAVRFSKIRLDILR